MKINLHILEQCNYRCKHCFAHFNDCSILKLNEWKRIVNNCIDSGLIDSFNIAGGEPMIFNRLEELCSYIKSRGASCSLITNGSLINELWIQNYSKLFDMIGISIDSLNPDTLKELGRIDSSGNYLNEEKLQMICDEIKKCNPSCRIKINTVISELNISENLCEKLLMMPIDRYKILKIRLFEDANFSNRNICISDEDFLNYLNSNLNIFGINYKSLDDYTKLHIINSKEFVVEDTVEASYLIVNPQGYLIDNSKNDSHIIVADLKKESFSDAIKKVSFDENIYNKRYLNQ